MIDARKVLWIALTAFALGVGVGAGFKSCAPGPVDPPKPPVVVPEKPKPDRVVYVFEKDDTAVPDEIEVAFDKLNREGIEATAVDDDIVNGDGETPDQYKAAIDAARLAGLPAIVLLSKGEFLDFAKLADLEAILRDAQ